jgi:hypothetical protein
VVVDNVHIMRISLMAVVLLTLWMPSGHAIESVRDQEIAQCLPGEVSTWGDNQDRPALQSPLRFAYRHDGAPDWFGQNLVMTAIEKAANAWSGCSIHATVVALLAGAPTPEGNVLIQWSDTGSRRNFGLANLGEKTLSLGPAAFQLLQSRNPAHDSRQTLQMLISHEMGHFFGVMAHSRRCVDVTSYYDNGKGETCFIRDGSRRPPGVEYRAVLPTACDIERCRAANGLAR